MSEIFSLIKNNFSLIFLTLSMMSFVKFLIRSYLNYKQIQSFNKDKFRIIKQGRDVASLEIETNNLKPEDIVNGFNSKNKASWFYPLLAEPYIVSIILNMTLGC